MTPPERRDLELLIQRLYGGSIDGEPGDVVQLKDDMKSIKRTLDRWDASFKVVIGIVSFFGITGIVALFRGFGL